MIDYSLPHGISSCFYRLSKQHGMKLYSSQNEAMEAWEWNTMMEEKCPQFVPKVYSTVFQFKKHKYYCPEVYYAYLVEYVVPLRDIMNCTHDNGDIPNYNISAIQNMFSHYISEFTTELQKTHKIRFYDNHFGNCGINQCGNIVCLDTGSESFGGSVKDWESNSLYND